MSVKLDPTRKHFKDSIELCEYIRAVSGPVVILAFSGGKDCVAAWLQLRKFFDQVIPVFRYTVPGLRFVEEAMAYYEDFFQTPVLRYPQPILYRMLDGEVYQTPARVLSGAMDKLVFTRGLEKEHIDLDVRELLGIPNAWEAGGERASDSMHRRNTIEKAGPLDYRIPEFYPVYDWKFSDICRALDESGCKLPVDYRLFNRSFDSIRSRFMPVLRDAYPDDYELILRWFPLSVTDEYRRVFAAKEATDEAA